MKLGTRRRGIMFADESVRAILGGRKTMTRRLVARALDFGAVANAVHKDGAGTGWIAWWGHAATAEETRKMYPGDSGFRCPHGAVGDHIWVREAFCHAMDDGRCTDKILYRADGHDVFASDGDGFHRWNKDGSEASPWRSPFYLKRADSRITLEITDVRVERLQDITEEDVKAEGVYTWAEGDHTCNVAETYFSAAWDRINGKRAPWASNPWVWVINFIKIAA